MMVMANIRINGGGVTRRYMERCTQDDAANTREDAVLSAGVNIDDFF
jgi:hypothetical protein